MLMSGEQTLLEFQRTSKGFRGGRLQPRPCIHLQGKCRNTQCLQKPHWACQAGGEGYEGAQSDDAQDES